MTGKRAVCKEACRFVFVYKRIPSVVVYTDMAVTSAGSRATHYERNLQTPSAKPAALYCQQLI